ncbi:hypothetical protein QR680_003821 [Steinernema hermaphroditum]|uniref:RING-CH-type domain-containing protein n=1 Tax=Steinernema hermaphroditum TaxID=289476 RepID=A0AA39HN30_9BILA|nr:hypothetical protein QR680_003821 [Steinernema hermaphroditum]
MAAIDIETMPEDAVCRICWLPASDESPLLQPCLCRGTQQYIHEDCILRFFRVQPAKGFKCQSCLHKYQLPEAEERFFARNRILINLLTTLYPMITVPLAYVPVYVICHIIGAIASWVDWGLVLPRMGYFVCIVTFFWMHSQEIYDKLLLNFYGKNRTVTHVEDYNPDRKLSWLQRFENLTWKIYDYRALWSSVTGILAPYGAMAIMKFVHGLC